MISKTIRCLIDCLKVSPKIEFGSFEIKLLVIFLLPPFIITLIWFFNSDFSSLKELGWFESIFVYLISFSVMFLFVFIGFSALLIALTFILGLFALAGLIILFLIGLVFGVLKVFVKF